MSTHFKKGISYAITTLLILLLILCTVFTISSRVNNGVPKIMGNSVYIVLSGSMEPSIRTGSIVAVKDQADKENLQVGEIVTFYSPFQEGTIITHRITEVRKIGSFTEYTTKGDNNPTADPLFIVPGDIIGVYNHFSLPFVGYFLSFISSKKGLALVVIIPSLLLILWQLISMWKTITLYEKRKQLPESAGIAES